MLNNTENTPANISEAFYPTLYQRLIDMIDSEYKICSLWMDPANGAIAFIDWALANGFDRTHRYLWRYDPAIEYNPENCSWKTRDEYEISMKNAEDEKFRKCIGKVIDANGDDITPSGDMRFQ